MRNIVFMFIPPSRSIRQNSVASKLIRSGDSQTDVMRLANDSMLTRNDRNEAAEHVPCRVEKLEPREHGHAQMDGPHE